jgi:hypothetical protein
MDKDNKNPGSKDKGNIYTKWNRDDEVMLVQTLIKAKEDKKWGDNNPKPAAWTACAAALSGSEIRMEGIAKNVKAIKTRWQRIRAYHIF